MTQANLTSNDQHEPDNLKLHFSCLQIVKMSCTFIDVGVGGFPEISLQGITGGRKGGRIIYSNGRVMLVGIFQEKHLWTTPPPPCVKNVQTNFNFN